MAWTSLEGHLDAVLDAPAPGVEPARSHTPANRATSPRAPFLIATPPSVRIISTRAGAR